MLGQKDDKHSHTLNKEYHLCRIEKPDFVTLGLLFLFSRLQNRKYGIIVKKVRKFLEEGRDYRLFMPNVRGA